MKLKKRDTIENVNFNSKGEKIKDIVFEDEEGQDKNRLGAEAEFSSSGLVEKENEENGILVAPGENDDKKVSVSGAIDSSIQIDNGSASKDHERKSKISMKKKVFILGGSLLFLFFIIGGFFGLNAMDVYVTKVPLKEILKGEGEVVVSLNSDTNFQQYKFLDDNLRKFPGYKLIEKGLDDVGEGKTISQAFQDELAAHNLSFDEDIKPVIENETVVVIPTIEPLTNELQRLTFDAGKRAKHALRFKELDGRIATTEDALMEGDITEAGKIKVLGLTSDFYTEGMVETEKKVEPVDFIIGAGLKSLKSAREVLNKIKGDTAKYEVSEVKFEGYTYYKVSQKIEEDDLNEYLLSVKDTYHALIGHNWVMATKEADLKEMISARKENHILSKMAFWKKSEVRMRNLASDQNYNAIKKDLSVQSQESLLSVYLKTDMNDLIPSANPESEQKQFFRTTEEDLLLGFLLRVTPDGLVFRTASNQLNFNGVQNVPIETGLIGKMPQKVANRWTDVYSETANIKDLYYNLKKNNLTDDGITAFNESREEMKQTIGTDFDFEADLIDHFNGNIALAAFTSEGLAPHGSLIVEIDDEVAMLNSVNKIVEMIKKAQLLSYQMMMGSPYEMNMEGHSIDPSSMDTKEEDLNTMPASPFGMSAETKARYEEKIKAIQESALIEKQTTAGSVYVYQIPEMPEISLNCAFSEGKMMIGTNQDVIVDLVKEFENEDSIKLAKTEDFTRVTQNIYPEGYAKSLITPLGVWNGISYYMENFIGVGAQDEETREAMDAIRTFVKTIDSVSTIGVVSEDSSVVKSAVYIDIKEVGAEEKEYAERILEKL